MPRRKEPVRLSKRLSYLLRHHPEDLDLRLDPDGFTRVTIAKLAERMGVGEQNIKDVVEADPKRRFEIRGGRIRANFGHSVPQGRTMWERRPPAAPSELPAQLYHGTPTRKGGRILGEGIRPRGRRMVHLSTTPEWARRVGSRHGASPEVLEIDVAEAIKRGVRMWRAGPATVVSTPVPPACIAVVRK